MHARRLSSGTNYRRQVARSIPHGIIRSSASAREYTSEIEQVNEPQRPLPTPSPETAPYWEGCKRRELQLPYCLQCERFFFYPRPFCPRCFSRDTEWRRASGRATLYTYAIQYRAQTPGFQAPYITAIVELEEGPRLVSNLVGVEPDPAQLRCGMPLEVVFEDMSDEITLPFFRPVGDAT